MYRIDPSRVYVTGLSMGGTRDLEAVGAVPASFCGGRADMWRRLSEQRGVVQEYADLGVSWGEGFYGKDS